MTDATIGRILLADDGSEAAGPAREMAVELASQTRAKLSIVYVLEPMETDQDGRDMLRSSISLAEQRGVTHDVLVQQRTGIGNAGRRIVEIATESGADVIVVGARGLSGVGRVLLGSVSNHVVHHAPCSVLVAR